MTLTSATEGWNRVQSGFDGDCLHLAAGIVAYKLQEHASQEGEDPSPCSYIRCQNLMSNVHMNLA
jgi:hypothetical protein